MEASSSIFSSEYLRRALTVPRRRYAWYALIVLCALAVFAASGHFLRKLPQQGETFVSNSVPLDEAEVLLLGNSQFVHIQYDWFEIPLANFAIAGADYTIDYALLRSLAPQMPKLKILLLNFDNLPLRVNSIKDREGDFRVLFQAGIKWYYLPVPSPVLRLTSGVKYSWFFEPLLAGPKPSLDWLHEYWRFPKAEAATNNAPELPGYDPTLPAEGFGTPAARGEDKMAGYVNLFGKSTKLAENFEAFHGILKYCQENQIKVILLRSPVTPEYSRARPPAWRKELEDLQLRAAEQYPDTLLGVWDEDYTGRYGWNVFNDPNHMASKGLLDYARRMEARLRVLLDRFG